MKQNGLILVFLSAMVLPMSGCAPLLVFGGVGAVALTVTDRRPNSVMVEDQNIEFKVDKEIKDLPKRSQIHINRVSYNGNVLLTGEVPSQDIGITLENAVRSIPNVKKIHNELVIAPKSTAANRTNDTLITGKVKTSIALIQEGTDFNAAHVKVVTERGVVYLMGLLRQNEVDVVVNKVRTVTGLQEVVPLFEFYNKGN